MPHAKAARLNDPLLLASQSYHSNRFWPSSRGAPFATKDLSSIAAAPRLPVRAKLALPFRGSELQLRHKKPARSAYRSRGLFARAFVHYQHAPAFVRDLVSQFGGSLCFLRPLEKHKMGRAGLRPKQSPVFLGERVVRKNFEHRTRNIHPRILTIPREFSRIAPGSNRFAS